MCFQRLTEFPSDPEPPRIVISTSSSSLPNCMIPLACLPIFQATKTACGLKQWPVNIFEWINEFTVNLHTILQGGENTVPLLKSEQRLRAGGNSPEVRQRTGCRSSSQNQGYEISKASPHPPHCLFHSPETPEGLGLWVRATGWKIGLLLSSSSEDSVVWLEVKGVSPGARGSNWVVDRMRWRQTSPHCRNREHMLSSQK